jgi:hypothetical protein
VSFEYLHHDILPLSDTSKERPREIHFKLPQAACVTHSSVVI